MIADDVRAHVAARLSATASEEGVRILYAAESGSRAWGFPSPDSDYDVRFVYAHERDWYVSLAEDRDVIERHLDEAYVDLKALRLALRSNPALYEWLVSPIVYVDGPLRAERQAKGSPRGASSRTCLARHNPSSSWRFATSCMNARLRGDDGGQGVQRPSAYSRMSAQVSCHNCTMRKTPEDTGRALTAVVRRLGQMYSLWHQASHAYFEPKQFTIALQNCITTSRTVTFILQSNKPAIPDFDNWYATYQQRFRDDSVMEWAKKARNKIEKQGDIETLSQVRAQLVAAYTGNPQTDWIPAEIVWSPGQLLRSIPSRLLDAHTIENGVLAIERRWVDVELPDREILDALAHVYGQFALMIVELHKHCGVDIPKERPDLGEPLLRNLLEDGRTPSMAPVDDREVYISVRDGSVLRYRLEFKRPHQDAWKKARRRYGENLHLRGLREAATLLEVARIYFRAAQAIMLRDGFHVSMFFPLKGTKPIDFIVAPPKNRTDKYMIMRDVARYVRRIGADGLIHISEAWVASREDLPHGRFADEASNRREALMLMAVNAQGEQISFVAQFERKLIKRHKVKRFGPIEIDAHDKIMAMAPVLAAWGKLDALQLNERDELDTWAENHFSAANPEKV